jgi:DNA-binding SARP family transcriptional activator
VATSAAHQARTLAALLEAPGSVGLAALALGRILGDERELRRAKDVLGPLGTWEWHSGLGAPGASGEPPVDSVATLVHNSSTNGSAEEPNVQLRCLGDFSLVISGQPIDEQVAKPMERALLHLLASRAGERIHREALIEALWPEADRDAGLHRLQVAVSSLRRLLAASAGDAQLLARDGDSYRLTLPQESDVDLWKLNRALRQSGQARGGRDRPGEMAALAEALTAYTGPLLPGDGPADWAAALRASLQAQVADAAGRLASLRLEDGDPQGAVEAARAGLAVDRYRDELWKSLIEAADQSGHHAEAGRARQAYAAVLEELGV